MILGTVLGEIPMARTLPGAENLRWVQIETGEGVLAAADLLTVQPGELVLVCGGAAAAGWVSGSPADAAVAAVVEKEVDKTGQKQL